MRLLASFRRLSSSASFFEPEPPKQPITFARRLGRRFASESDSSLEIPAQANGHKVRADILAMLTESKATTTVTSDLLKIQQGRIGKRDQLRRCATLCATEGLARSKLSRQGSNELRLCSGRVPLGDRPEVAFSLLPSSNVHYVNELVRCSRYSSPTSYSQ